MKDRLVFILVFFSLFGAVLFITKTTSAVSFKNPIFVTVSQVEKMIVKVLQPIINRLNNHDTQTQKNTDDITELKLRVGVLEDEIVKLKEIITELVSKKGTISGEMHDANTPQLGLMQYIGNSNRFDFWFRPNTGVLGYIADHYYHVIYQKTVDNPSDWCGQTTVPDRPPYNLFGNAGQQVYFKIFDTTANTTPCF